MRLLDAWIGWTRRGGAAALDAVLPPRCVACGTGIDRPRGLCGACWGALAFIDGPCCARCGLPFPFDAGEGALCGGCIADPPAYGRARAALRYDDASRGLILAFKHGDRLEGARLFGSWMARAAKPLADGIDVVAPVPLHPFRLFLRLYNQSAILAHALGRGLGLPVVPDLLRRTRWTPSQAGRNVTERHANVRRAFAVPPARSAEARDKRVLLVDDVFTTGATAEAAAQALLRAGARSVDVVALARVVRPERVPI